MSSRPQIWIRRDKGDSLDGWWTHRPVLEDDLCYVAAGRLRRQEHLINAAKTVVAAIGGGGINRDEAIELLREALWNIGALRAGTEAKEDP